MRSKIFTLALAPALLAAFALTSNQAQAQARLTVPFSFAAGGRICPAGTYTVARDPGMNTVILTSREARRSFAWLVGPAAQDPTDNKVVLEFDETESGHALRSIQYGTMVTSRLDGHAAGSRRILAVRGMGQ
ncbi:MAG TPA: hypothetical protein VMA34_10620 [Terracidiphilus sp.]|nr:hypothetical protein [Terracidiphilus sp.]